MKLLETFVSAEKSKASVITGATPMIGDLITVEVILVSDQNIALSDKEVKLEITPMDGIEIQNMTAQTDQDGKGQLKFIANSKGVKRITVTSGELEIGETRAVIVKPKQQLLTGDMNKDQVVNIFDLVITTSQFGKVGAGLIGDVNGDGSVNIFDLVIVAGNFGKSLVAAAPSMVSKVKLTTEQKHHIAHAIDQLESNANLSSAEEIALNVLKSILPERLPTQTQLLANYPNPFNPETWIPYHLSQDSEVVVRIYDTTGKIVRTLDLGFQSFGYYVGRDKSAYWDGRTENGELVSSGTYFYQLETDQYSETRKMVILK